MPTTQLKSKKALNGRAPDVEIPTVEQIRAWREQQASRGFIDDVGELIVGSPTPRPCPFCAEGTCVEVYPQGHLYVAGCGNCGAEGPAGATKLEAAELWNGSRANRVGDRPAARSEFTR